MQAWIYWIGGGLGAAIGLGLIGWALFRDRSRGRLRCPKCWYDMSGTGAGEDGSWICPECGRVVTTESGLLRTRRRWRWAVVGVLVSICGTTFGFRVWSIDWVEITPTFVLFHLEMSDRFATDAIYSELNYDRFGSNRMWDWEQRWLTTKAIKILQTDDRVDKRDETAWLLACVGARDDRITSVLLDALDDESSQVRQRVVRSFGLYRAEAQRVVAPLLVIAADADEDVSVRSEAISILIRYGQLAASAEPLLASLLNHPDPGLRAAAAYVLPSISLNNGQYLSVLVSLLDDTDASVRESAAQALGQLGPIAAETVPRLLVELESTTPGSWDREDILRSLALIGAPIQDETILESIINNPSEPYSTVVLAQYTLGIVRGDYPDFNTALSMTIQDSDRDVCLSAIREIRWLHDPELLPSLLLALDNSDPAVIERAAMAIRSCNVYDQGALDKLKRLRDSKAGTTRDAFDYAISSLERMETRE